MKIVAAVSVMPERRGAFRAVLRTILQEQRRPVDRLDVYLKGSASIPTDYPLDARLHYIVDRLDGGPWTRYLSAEDLESDDTLVTVDDDTEYPPDFIEVGMSELGNSGDKTVVSYGGVLWDPLGAPHGYIENSWRFLPYNAFCGRRVVALPMGGASFFRAELVKNSVAFPLQGFKTNDDMMIGQYLQKRGIRVLCAPKPEGWIRELPAASSASALYRRDSDVRHVTFRDLIDKLGFDPTVGELNRYLSKARRILVIADSLPPLPGTEELDQRLRGMCAADVGVHVLAPLPSSLVGEVMSKVNAPYEVHAVSVPEPGGRLDWAGPVRAWRNWRVDRQTRKKWAFRECLARERLQPTEVYRCRDRRLWKEGAA